MWQAQEDEREWFPGMQQQFRASSDAPAVLDLQWPLSPSPTAVPTASQPGSPPSLLFLRFPWSDTLSKWYRCCFFWNWALPVQVLQPVHFPTPSWSGMQPGGSAVAEDKNSLCIYLTALTWHCHTWKLMSNINRTILQGKRLGTFSWDLPEGCYFLGLAGNFLAKCFWFFFLEGVSSSKLKQLIGINKCQ